MPRNGSGSYSRVASTPYVYNTVIDQVVVNAEMDDIATALTNSLAKNGETTPTANLPMGGFKLTGLAAGSSAGDSVRYEQVALLAGAGFTGGINEKLSTVASATTPDIFALTVGNVIDYTGTATCTGFVAAPQAGARRTLVCAGAAPFTAGANMLIEGVTSGQNLTCAAGTQVDVVAVTTTQFRLTFTPVSGTTTPTVTSATGTLTSASGTLTYTRIKDRCFFNASCTITTNGTGATSISFTLPFTHAAAEASVFVGRETAVTGNQLWGYISGGASSGIIVNLNSGTYPAADGYILRVSGAFPIA